jgi:hypothetical protein
MRCDPKNTEIPLPSRHCASMQVLYAPTINCKLEGLMASSDLKECNAGHRVGHAVLWWLRRGRVGTAPNFHLYSLWASAVTSASINAPFSPTAEYDDDCIGHYHAIKSELVSIIRILLIETATS